MTFVRAIILFRRAPPLQPHLNINYLSKVPYPKTITVEGRVSTYEFGVGHKYSVHYRPSPCSVPIILSFLECHINETIQCTAFCLTTFTLHYGFEIHHVVECISSLFFVVTSYYSIVRIYHNLFIHSPVDRHLSCFQFGSIMTKTAVNIHAQVFIETYDFWASLVAQWLRICLPMQGTQV